MEANQFADRTFEEFEAAYLIQDPQVSYAKCNPMCCLASFNQSSMNVLDILMYSWPLVVDDREP